MQREKIVTGEFYHVYNRGVEKRPIYLDASDFARFISSLNEFNTNDPAWKVADDIARGRTSNADSLVNIIAYCLNPNHFHLILEQRVENGITIFMRKLGTGYTMYFNKRYDRSGVLFQGKFKYIHINSNEYLLYLSVYVNCNCEIHSIAPDARSYRWCSFPDYVGNRNGLLPKKDIILEQFRNISEYENFAKVNAGAMKGKKDMQKLLLE